MTNKLKIAVVKSDDYQDLWVSDISSDPFQILKSTLMRTPQLGLTELFDTKFIIVKESNEFPCQLSKDLQGFVPFDKHTKTKKSICTPFLHEEYHNNISVDSIAHNCDDIEWDQFDIVICINLCIPARIVNCFNNILWCYYISENFNNDPNRMVDVIKPYDIFLNQEAHIQNYPPNVIGFPYSFLGPDTLTNICINKLNLENITKDGIYMEINNTTERPVQNIPEEFMHIADETNQKINMHYQDILKNLQQLYSSKYYVKILGRPIRGNSILEAISCHTLVLCNKNKLFHCNLLPDNCHVETVEDVINKIKYFDNNPCEYQDTLNNQRKLLSEYYYFGPTNKLIEQYNNKNKNLSN